MKTLPRFFVFDDPLATLIRAIMDKATFGFQIGQMFFNGFSGYVKLFGQLGA